MEVYSLLDERGVKLESHAFLDTRPFIGEPQPYCYDVRDSDSEVTFTTVIQEYLRNIENFQNVDFRDENWLLVMASHYEPFARQLIELSTDIRMKRPTFDQWCDSDMATPGISDIQYEYGSLCEKQEQFKRHINEIREAIDKSEVKYV